MDIAKTIEPFCNFTLTYWQKEYAQKLFDAEMEGNHLVYCIPPVSYTHLRAHET